jgi:hypothetical protein
MPRVRDSTVDKWYWAGPHWQTLSIPRGKSKEFDVVKDGVPYRAG